MAIAVFQMLLARNPARASAVLVAMLCVLVVHVQWQPPGGQGKGE